MHFFRSYNQGLGLYLGLLVCPVAPAGPIPDLKPAAYPSWWFERDLIRRVDSGNTDPDWPEGYPPAHDYAAANIGQLKHTARLAYDEFQSKFPAVVWDTPSGLSLTAMIRAWYLDDALTQPKTAGAQDHAALNQGQLKYVASRFYDVLAAVGYTAAPLQGGRQYPWTKNTGDDQSYALVNLGQLKRVFSFQPATFLPSGDVDQDLLTDGWELDYWGNLSQGAYDDPDQDGSPNYYELRYNTNPTLSTATPAAHYQVDAFLAPDNVTRFLTIDAALAAAAEAAEDDPVPTPRVIKVASGRYTGAANTQLTRPLENILLISEAGAGSTILDGDGMSIAGITLGDRGGLVGFTLENFSGGVCVRGDNAWVADCVIKNTRSTTSASVTVQGADDFLLRDTTIQDGSTRGIYLAQSSAALRRLIVRGNATAGGGGALMLDGGAAVLMENCLLLENTANDAGAAIKMDGTGNELDISQCTVVDNEGRDGYATVVLTRNSGLVGITNSIFWNFSTSAEFEGAPSELAVDYSLVRNGFDGVGNLSDLPRLGEGAYPSADSPVLDRGTLDGVPNHDLAGRPRPQGPGVDIGAFERQAIAMQLPEWWQIKHFGAAGVSPDADPDVDGATNLEEYNANTDPNDSLNGDFPVLIVVSGEGQEGTASTFLPDPLVVLVTDQKGNPAPGIAIRFRAAHPAALLYEDTDPGTTGARLKLKNSDSTGSATIHIKP